VPELLQSRRHSSVLEGTAVCEGSTTTHPVKVLLHELQLLGAEFRDGLRAIAHRHSIVAASCPHPLAPNIFPDAI